MTVCIYFVFLCSWNEWVTLPIQYNDLPRTAQLALTVYDCLGPNKMFPVGGTTISMFSKYGLFRQVGDIHFKKKIVLFDLKDTR